MSDYALKSVYAVLQLQESAFSRGAHALPCEMTKSGNKATSAKKEKTEQAARVKLQSGEGYHFYAHLGCIKLGFRASYADDMRNLDKIFGFLDHPRPREMHGISASLSHFQTKICVRIARIWNLLFGDHQWYNESRARKAIKSYIQDAAKQGNDTPQHQKALAIYDRLAVLDHAGKSWVSGIERRSLDKQLHLDFECLKAAAQKIGRNPAFQAAVNNIWNACVQTGKKWALAKSARLFGAKKVPTGFCTYADLAAWLINAAASELTKKPDSRRFHAVLEG